MFRKFQIDCVERWIELRDFFTFWHTISFTKLVIKTNVSPYVALNDEIDLKSNFFQSAAMSHSLKKFFNFISQTTLF